MGTDSLGKVVHKLKTVFIKNRAVCRNEIVLVQNVVNVVHAVVSEGDTL